MIDAIRFAYMITQLANPSKVNGVYFSDFIQTRLMDGCNVWGHIITYARFPVR